MSRKQCAKCPWRVDVNPNDIPNGYCVKKHAALESTIAKPGEVRVFGELRMMACHETPVGKEKPCVGWLANQIGPGNNVMLRLSVILGRVDGDIQTVGEQHGRLEDTLPRRRDARRSHRDPDRVPHVRRVQADSSDLPAGKPRVVRRGPDVPVVRRRRATKVRKP